MCINSKALNKMVHKKSRTQRIQYNIFTESKLDNKLNKAYSLAKLRLLSKYGLGCAVFSIDGNDLKRYFLFATGKKEKIEEKIIEKALPNAYPIALSDCREYFLINHNERIRREKSKKLKDFCLAEIVMLVEIKNVTELSKKEKSEMKFILNSPISSQIQLIGIVQEKRRKIPVVLDTLNNVRVGDTIIIHRNVACEKL